MFEREWRFYLDDMIQFSEKVLVYSRHIREGACLDAASAGWR